MTGISRRMFQWWTCTKYIWLIFPLFLHPTKIFKTSFPFLHTTYVIQLIAKIIRNIRKQNLTALLILKLISHNYEAFVRAFLTSSVSLIFHYLFSHFLMRCWKICSDELQLQFSNANFSHQNHHLFITKYNCRYFFLLFLSMSENIYFTPFTIFLYKYFYFNISKWKLNFPLALFDIKLYYECL